VTQKPTFKYTADQTAALQLLRGAAHHVILYGGSRSGKTFLIVAVLILRARSRRRARVTRSFASASITTKLRSTLTRCQR
jgi:hypothetical protein